MVMTKRNVCRVAHAVVALGLGGLCACGPPPSEHSRPSIRRAGRLTKPGRCTEALAAYRQAVRLRPDSAEAHNDLGAVLYDVGERDAAVQEYQRALRLQPEFAEAHNNLGVAALSAGQIVAAVGEYRQAVALKPEFSAALQSVPRTRVAWPARRGTPSRCASCRTRPRSPRPAAPSPASAASSASLRTSGLSLGRSPLGRCARPSPTACLQPSRGRNCSTLRPSLAIPSPQTRRPRGNSPTRPSTLTSAVGRHAPNHAAHATDSATRRDRRHRRLLFRLFGDHASVVSSRPATDAAFCNALRTTLVGSTIPAFMQVLELLGGRVEPERPLVVLHLVDARSSLPTRRCSQSTAAGLRSPGARSSRRPLPRRAP